MLIIFKELTKHFEQSLLDSLEKNDKKGEFDNLRKNLVTQSSKEEFGDYQCNVCLSLSKIYKKKPKEISDYFVDLKCPTCISLAILGLEKSTITLLDKLLSKFFLIRGMPALWH